MAQVGRVVSELMLVLECENRPHPAENRLFSRTLGRLLFTVFLPLLVAAVAMAQSPPQEAGTGRGLAIVQNSGYPELRVDGAAFFIHSAAFFYYRIPRDLWENSLDQHRELGINTIDLSIPWNWHEPREGQFDFDGSTNPRRDLRGLLRLIAEKGFRLIARPGPLIRNEWRHGGYPEWLLERPEYGMSATDRLDGRYPPLADRSAADAEDAARGWLENETHMKYARRWLEAVARELGPYSASGTLRVKVADEMRGEQEPEEKEVGGPLLFVQLDDTAAGGGTHTAGPGFWRYLGELRGMLEAGGLDVPCFLNTPQVRLPAADAGLSQPIALMGQWFLPADSQPGANGGEIRLTALDAANIEFTVELLKTQPAFAPVVIGYQAGWHAPAEDVRPAESPPANTLLSSRLLLAHGLKGLNYFPAQDSLAPAGYETPTSNRHYRWEGALDADANRQHRARALARNAQMLATWSELLAASHKRADFGLVYPPVQVPQQSPAHEAFGRVSATVKRLERLAHLAGFVSELVDADDQPIEQLLRHRVLFLPVLEQQDQGEMSEKAQQALTEYVRRGGTLVWFPARPTGRILAEMWRAAEASEPAQEPGGAARWRFGQGEVIEFTKDFYSWVLPEESFQQNRARFEAMWGIQTLHNFLKLAGVRPAVKRAPWGPGRSELIVTQLVSNDGTGVLGTRTGGRGLISVTNLDSDEAAEEALEFLSPRAGAPGRQEEYIKLPVSVPPRESLLLPLHYPLCSAAKLGQKCTDEVVAAGAELLRAEREGKTLELTFYTPARATILLQLERGPRRITLDEMKPEATWTEAKHRMAIVLLRGASPGFLRTVKVHLPYAPHVPEKPDPDKQGRRDYDYQVADAVRLPLGDSTSLASHPPLVLIEPQRDHKLLLQARNYDELGRDLDVRIEGEVRGSAGIGLDAGETRHVPVNLKVTRKSEPASNGGVEPTENLLRSELEVKSGRDRRTTPIFFATVEEEKVSHYRFDFDRDGWSEWVLENQGLRLMVSPEAGGRAVALVDKSSGVNLTTTVGALRDHFVAAGNSPGNSPRRARELSGLWNRAYRAAWVAEEKDTGLRLDYDAPDVSPAGAKLSKTVRLSGPDSVEVQYAVSLAAPRTAAERAGEIRERAFVAVNSVPVLVGGDRTTQFCWQEVLPGGLAADANDQKESARHCEPFVAGGGELVVPRHVKRLEVRTPGRIGLAVEWEVGRMTIDRKQFSALLRLNFPPLIPGGEAGRDTLRFRVLSAE